MYSKRNCSINWHKHFILTCPSIRPARQWTERNKEQKQPYPEKKDQKTVSIHPLRSPKGLMRHGICEAEAKNRWSGLVTDSKCNCRETLNSMYFCSLSIMGIKPRSCKVPLWLPNLLDINGYLGSQHLKWCHCWLFLNLSSEQKPWKSEGNTTFSSP